MAEQDDDPVHLTFNFRFDEDHQLVMDREIDTTTIEDPNLKVFARRFFEGLSFAAMTRADDFAVEGNRLQMASRAMVDTGMFETAEKIADDESEYDTKAHKERIN